MQKLIEISPFVFSLKNSDVKATGKVGLSLGEDTFKTINYDVQYQPTGSYLSVRELSVLFTKMYSLLILLLLLQNISCILFSTCNVILTAKQ
jgi:hypothetical protein